MPNPFPGMAPYLEGPLWTMVHSNLIEEIARQLAPQLRPKYLALTNQRVVVAVPDPVELPQTRSPDVGIYSNLAANAGDATAVLSAPLVLNYLAAEDQPQTFLEIRAVADHRLVTAVEVLSPTNKRGEALADFCRKRQELLSGEAHYIEIDLLRIGQRFPLSGILPSVPYFVFVSRRNTRPKEEIWPIALDQPLPPVPVPLLAGDLDVHLDLQRALNTVYELFGYDTAADHRGDPALPLPPEWSTWAHERLRVAGIK